MEDITLIQVGKGIVKRKLVKQTNEELVVDLKNSRIKTLEKMIISGGTIKLTIDDDNCVKCDKFSTATWIELIQNIRNKKKNKKKKNEHELFADIELKELKKIGYIGMEAGDNAIKHSDSTLDFNPTMRIEHIAGRGYKLHFENHFKNILEYNNKKIDVKMILEEKIQFANKATKEELIQKIYNNIKDEDYHGIGGNVGIESMTKPLINYIYSDGKKRIESTITSVDDDTSKLKLTINIPCLVQKKEEDLKFTS